jgi:hypothetical protein
MTILRDYARKVRAKESAKAASRFETEPGRLAQVDWKEAGTWGIDGVPRKAYAFVILLGYSRRTFVRFTTDMKLPTLGRWGSMLSHQGATPSGAAPYRITGKLLLQTLRETTHFQPYQHPISSFYNPLHNLHDRIPMIDFWSNLNRS